MDTSKKTFSAPKLTRIDMREDVTSLAQKRIDQFKLNPCHPLKEADEETIEVYAQFDEWGFGNDTDY